MELDYNTIIINNVFLGGIFSLLALGILEIVSVIFRYVR